MIDARAIEKIVVDGLKVYVSTTDKPCEVVRANQTGPVPPYPYVAYTITTLAQSRSGTFSVAPDGTRFREFTQTWSFTVQSDDADECANVALKAWDWFMKVGCVYLSDNMVVVQNVGNINNRDNLITIEYEYRSGFDVAFNLLNTVTMSEAEIGGYIETAHPIRIKEDTDNGKK